MIIQKFHLGIYRVKKRKSKWLYKKKNQGKMKVSRCIIYDCVDFFSSLFFLANFFFCSFNEVVTFASFLFFLRGKKTKFWLQLGMAMGRGGPKDGIFAPAPHGFFLPHPRPASHDGENFLPHPRPLRPHEDPWSPALPRKTLFLINFPYNYYHFFK